MFARWGRRYFEAGLSVFPVLGKVPQLKDRARLCREMPTEEDFEKWEAIFSDEKFGIGLALGPASGVIGLDIDDPTLVSALPTSHVIRGGRPGRRICFFKFNGEPTKAWTGLDLLSDGRQCVMPPSLHPNTGEPYMWLAGSLPDSDLPELDLQRVYRVADGIQRIRQAQGLPTYGTGTGRNPWLTAASYAMACAGDSVEAITDALLKSEAGTWFHDPKKVHKGRNPAGTARAMAERAIKAANAHGARLPPIEFNITNWPEEPAGGVLAARPGSLEPEYAGAPVAIIQVANVSAPVSVVPAELPPHDTNVAGFQKAVNKVAAKVTAEEKLLAPSVGVPSKPAGILGDTIAAIERSNNSEIPALAIGGAVAIWATVASNRVRFGTTWPTTFVMNIAPTGTGKAAPYKVAEKMLEGTDLLGHGLYKSGASIVDGLGPKRERLDMLDEVGTMFNTMKGGGVFQAEMVDILCRLWSSVSTTFRSATTHETRSQKKQTAFENACVNLLASTTNSGIVASTNRLMAEKGLIPRFIVFRQGLGKWQRAEHPDLSRLQGAVKMALEYMPVIQGPDKGHLQSATKLNLSDDSVANGRDRARYPRELIAQDASVLDRIADMEKASHEKRLRMSLTETGAPEDRMLGAEARRTEHVLRLALICAFCEGVDWMLAHARKLKGQEPSGPELLPAQTPAEAMERAERALMALGGPRYVEQTPYGPHAQGEDVPWVLRHRHLDWAAEVYAFSFSSQDDILEAVENRETRRQGDAASEQLTARVLKKLADHGADGMVHSALLSTTSPAQRKILTEVLTWLAETERVAVLPIVNAKGKAARLYVLREHVIEAASRHGIAIGAGAPTLDLSKH